MQISIVIPTYNRKARLLSLLADLDRSVYPIAEVIIVDAGNDRLEPAEYSGFLNLKVIHLVSESSVCIQRNTGIRVARSPWIFVCDDDNEIPPDYLDKLVTHTRDYPQAGAVSGIVLARVDSDWKPGYNIFSAKELFFKYIFRLSIWGSIECSQNNILVQRIKRHYLNKGNHISKAGWPVITDFSGDFFITPVYGLGASLIRKSWLELSPYDEVLDRHGMGDNYGVAVGFPKMGIHVLNQAFVYHHHEQANRLQKPLQYARRVFALDYFIKTKKNMQHVKKPWLLWSLFGNMILFFFNRDKAMATAASKTFVQILLGKTPYYPITGSRSN